MEAVRLTQTREVLDMTDACAAVLSIHLQRGKAVYGAYRTFYHCASDGLKQNSGVDTRYDGSVDVRCSYGVIHKL
jgi:hypothetical protein